jgi:SAM-dependent methyltransferase
MLEIGLGTNNTDVVSNMGQMGRPGASLRAFRDFLPNAEIYGADIDKRILFKEERISTFFVDQTDLNSFAELDANVSKKFDLIIDDGLHSPNANIAVLIFALTRLKRDGWLVIEDVNHDALPVWQVVAALLPGDFKPYIIEARVHLVFAIQKQCEVKE